MKKILFVNQSLSLPYLGYVKTKSREKNLITIISGSLNKNLNLPKWCKYINFKRYSNKSTLSRILTWFIFSFQVFFYCVFNGRKYASIHFCSNPPIIFFFFLILKKFNLINQINYLIYDIYPEVICQKKIFKKNSLLIRLWKYFDTEFIKISDNNLTLTERMKNTLIVRNISPDRVAISPIILPLKKKVILKNKKIIFDKFKVNLKKKNIIYTGNMSVQHDLFPILKTLHKLKKFKKFYNFNFIFTGNGEKLYRYKEFSKKNSLSNVYFLGFVSSNELKILLDNSYFGLLSIQDRFLDTMFPSKYIHYLSYGLPVIGYIKGIKVKNINYFNKNRNFFLCENENSLIRILKKIINNKIYFNKKITLNFFKKNFTKINSA